MSLTISAKTVGYRQGHVEIRNIHPGCVNIEVWAIDPDSDLRPAENGHLVYEDHEVIGDVELELSPDEALMLAQQLIASAEAALDEASTNKAAILT